MNFAITYPACLALGVCLLAATPMRARDNDRSTDTEKQTMLEVAKGFAPTSGHVALAATWEAKDGQADAVADILRRMADAVKSEPGTLLFWPHRSSSDGRVFFPHELFVDDAAFAAHQQTDHFKKLVVGEALPKLARRERVQIKPFRPDTNPSPFAE